MPPTNNASKQPPRKVCTGTTEIVGLSDLGLLRPGLLEVYRDGLLHNTLPFWFPRANDPTFGGYITSLDQDGTWLQTDKAVWFQGRAAWLMASLYNTVEQRDEWLVGAKSGIDFLEKHCFDTDGRMFFLVTREGRPLRKRRYLFSETFAVIAFAAYGVASKQAHYINRAFDLFQNVLKFHRTPGLLAPKIYPETRSTKGLAMPMILTVTAQELRKAINAMESQDAATMSSLCTKVIDESIMEIQRDFVKPECRCVLEMVGTHGEFIDTFEGRAINPGHSIEAGWFILEEARLRARDPALIELGCQIIDWSLELGWDQQYGGLLYNVDAQRLPCTEYWHDMKFWWPHNEAIIAALLAFELTGNPKYARWLGMVHDWAFAHFPDPVYGEWFGYLHRDGTVSTRLKGNIWKGPFHLPRMQWYCWQRLAAMRNSAGEAVNPGKHMDLGTSMLPLSPRSSSGDIQ